MSTLSETIDRRLKELGIRGSKMCDDLGISRSTLTELRKGRISTLKADRAARIAAYLGLSVSELLNGSDDEDVPAPAIGFDDFTYALHNESKELTPENKEKLLDMARMLKLVQDAEEAQNQNQH